ncbi:hypothetical protein GGI42DRAFT_333536, partial [Trichoderma sp. SZMC 28013]
MAWLHSVHVCLLVQTAKAPSLANCFNSLRSDQLLSANATVLLSFACVYFFVLLRTSTLFTKVLCTTRTLRRSGSLHQSEAHSTPFTLDL